MQNADQHTDQPFSLIGEFKALPGKGAELAQILAEAGASNMPGNLAYHVSLPDHGTQPNHQSNNQPNDQSNQATDEEFDDADVQDSIWIFELWESKQAHQDSLKLPAIQEAIAKGRPLIAGMGMRVETRPVEASGVMGKTGKIGKASKTGDTDKADTTGKNG